MGLSTTAHPPGAYADFHVGTSPYGGLAVASQVLGFMVWSLDERLVVFSDVLQARPYVRGVSAGYDDGSRALFLGDAHPTKSWG